MDFYEKSVNFNYNNYYYNEKDDLICNTYSNQFKFNFYPSKENHKTINKWLENGHFYENDVGLFLTNILKLGDIAIDVGANIGLHTLLMSSLVGENGKVIAFEPGNESFNELTQNVKLNNFNNLELKNKALGNGKNKKLKFNDDQFDSGHSSIISEKESNESFSREITVNTLDSHTFKYKKIKVVKIDVEGYEKHILNGCKKLLENNKVRYWIVEYAPHCLAKYGENLSSIRNFFRKYGYDMFVLDPSSSLPKFIPSNAVVHAKLIPNLLFTKMKFINKDWLFEDLTSHINPRNLFKP